MRFYSHYHTYYCGIDLHTSKMYVCITDGAGTVLVHRNVSANPEALARVVEPYREDLVLAVECVFVWYWIADVGAELGVHFVLGHALYMKAIHGGKAKNDRVDSQKIAGLLRAGMLSLASTQNYRGISRSCGIGATLALVILYEMGEIARFPRVGTFISYARQVKCAHESAGKRSTGANNKGGNAHFKWAFSEVSLNYRAETRPRRLFHSQTKECL